ncbi:nucleotide-binding protein [Halarchaeum nitratireducens]|nr:MULTISPECIES: AAA family ATPase [Halarchaeum]MBP2250572.1 septum site-determining protein MinD [Halarchaeum solikamskense]
MLAIAGGKGGVGKTTTALCLADAYVRRRRRPLAVDADRGMPNCHLYAGTAGERGVADIAAGVPIDAAAEPAAAPPGVDVLAGGDADPETYLDALPADRPVILDTAAAGAGADVGAALAAADAAVVVATPDRDAVRDGLKSAALARALGTPVVACVVVATAGDVTGIERVVEALTAPVPAARDPLTDVAVAVAHGRVAGVIGPNA